MPRRMNVNRGSAGWLSEAASNRGIVVQNPVDVQQPREAPKHPAIGDDRKVFSVSDLTRNIRFLLEQNFSNLWVEGEICNFKFHTSGHMYFTLKDETAQIQCVMFRAENQKLDFELGEGLSVLCFGRISVYPVRGQYQLYVERIEPKGVGALQLRFQQLKENEVARRRHL